MAVLKNLSTGAPFVIDRDQIYIGRDPGNDVVIQDVGVTGYHARIIKTARGYLLIEERTSTGIWFEEQKVPNLFLANGTRFRLGNTGFVFEIGAAVPGALAETVKAPSIDVPPPPGLEPPPLVLQAHPAVATPIVPTPPAPAPAPAPPPPTPAPPTAAPPPAIPAPKPPPAPPEAEEDGTPAWAAAGLSQLSIPAADGEFTGFEEADNCPGCEASLIGLERFCAICGTRTKYGRRGRVMLLKVIALLLILGAGFFGLYTLTDGDLSRDGFKKAISRVVGEDVPSWLEL